LGEPRVLPGGAKRDASSAGRDGPLDKRRTEVGRGALERAKRRIEPVGEARGGALVGKVAIEARSARESVSLVAAAASWSFTKSPV
jgi:hypothetical protein